MLHSVAPELNLGPLEEYYVLLLAETFLQPLFCFPHTHTMLGIEYRAMFVLSKLQTLLEIF